MMAVSDSARTHMVYQLIIVTLLFLSIGYNELLPDRKFALILAAAPVFCYQLVILSCCMELIPVPRWMAFLKQGSEPSDTSSVSMGTRSCSSDSIRTSSPIQSEKSMSFPDATEIPWRRQKSVTNLGSTAKSFVHSQKSKSWMSLNESKSAERLLSSREGSLDVLVPLSTRKCASSILKQADRTRSREDRSQKARSWKPGEVNFRFSSTSRAELAKSTSLSAKSPEKNLSSCTAEYEESELSKSFSFPFRQKRLETWLERNNETSNGDSNQSLDMPYWHSVGYNLAVKYEARKRQRASDNADGSEIGIREPVPKHQEAGPSDRHNHRKGSKLAAARINKLRAGISNLINKKRDEGSESGSGKAGRSSLLLKLRNKNVSCPASKDKPINVPEFTRFSNDDRPQIFYPRYLPFEKERFENDVKNKMKELSGEQRTLQSEGKDFSVLV